MCSEYSRVNDNTVSPVVMAGRQTALWRRLEGTAVWVLRDVTRLVVDDSLDERRELLVLTQQRVIVRKLVCSVAEPLSTLQQGQHKGVHMCTFRS